MIGGKEEPIGQNPMDRKPFFSIIIPVYNVAPYLRECLDSVLAQTFADWEAICVDDGSTDGSGAILDEYAARDPRLRIFHQPNAGVSAARNKALDEAKGEYVTFLDGDDVVDQDWLKVFSEVIDSEKCDVVRGAFSRWHYELEQLVAPAREYQVVSQYRTAAEVRAWGIGVALEDGYSWLNCIRRNVIGTVRFPTRLRFMEDCIFSATVMTYVKSLAVVNFAGYHYRTRGRSAVQLFNAKRSIIWETNDFFIELGKLWMECGLREDMKEDMYMLSNEITKHVFHSTMIHGVLRKIDVENPNEALKAIIDTVHKLEGMGAVNIHRLSLFEKLALKCFMHNGRRFSTLLLWDVYRGVNKFKRMAHRRNFYGRSN